MASSKINVVSVHTDGSASWKAADGGWAFVTKFRGERMIRYGFADRVTNNQMELLAVIRALEFITPDDHPIRIYSDSQYVVNAANFHIPGWKKDKWKNAFGLEPKNVDLMKQLDTLVQEHRAHGAVTFTWVKGHANNKYNNLADEYAGKARKERITNWS